jgi:hypothetical protein
MIKTLISLFNSQSCYYVLGVVTSGKEEASDFAAQESTWAVMENCQTALSLL